MHIKKHLGFSGLIKQVSLRLSQIEDYRQQIKVECSLEDCFLSGLAMMYFQDPGLLPFQRRMQEGIQRNNLTTLFKVKNIPKETQMRDVIDEIFPLTRIMWLS